MYISFYFVVLTIIHVISCSNLSTKRVRPTRVLVTGAGGSVGFYVFKKLLKRKQQFYPIGLIRDPKSATMLLGLGAEPDQVRIADIRDKSAMKDACEGCEKVVLCTSASPKKYLLARIKNRIRKFLGREVHFKGSDAYYPKGQDPYNVDFLGQKNVIDAAVEAKVDHIVMLGNMGGYRGGKLNEIGRKEGETNPKVGNLLKWKRASERYLMKRSFFTIVHSAVLIDEPGGQREVVWDVDDSLLRTSMRKIPKEDCAEVLVQALLHKESISRSIDIASKPLGQGTPTKDWLRFWSMPGNCIYPADNDGLSE